MRGVLGFPFLACLCIVNFGCSSKSHSTAAPSAKAQCGETSGASDATKGLNAQERHAALGPAIPAKEQPRRASVASATSKSLGAALSPTPNAEKRSEDNCDQLLKAHSTWLGGMGGLIATLGSLAAASPGEADAYESGYGTIQMSGKEPGAGNKRFEVYVRDEKASKLAERWEQYRNTVDAPPGQRLAGFHLDRGCQFKGVNLSLADLSHLAGFEEDFSNSLMVFATLHGHKFYKSSFRDVNLFGADLSDSQFVACDFTGANLAGAMMAGTKFAQGTILNGVSFAHADLTGATFEPSQADNVLLFNTEGLDRIKFQNPKAIVNLRKLTKENGQNDEARALSAAIFRQHLASEPVYSRFFDNYVRGGRLTLYGVKPWTPVLLLATLIPVFAVPYSVSLFGKGQAGIKVLHYVDGALEKEQRQHSIRISGALSGKPKTPIGLMIRKVLFAVRLPLYCSLLSAFQIGYHDINIGGWISRIQSRPYSLRGVGWVRSVAGVQSFISLYLLAMWILTLFSNPFE